MTENRRKSKRLTEKSVNGLTTTIASAATVVTNKRVIANNDKTRGQQLKENDNNLRKSKRRCVRLSTPTETDKCEPKQVVVNQRKYGLRKLAPINWKERLDMKYTSIDHKSTIDKTNDNKCYNKTIKHKTISKDKCLNNNKINNRTKHKINGKTKVTSITVTSKTITTTRQTLNKKKKNKHQIHVLSEKSLANNEQQESQELSTSEASTPLTNESADNDITEETIEDKSNEESVNVSYFDYVINSLENNNKCKTMKKLSFDRIMNIMISKQTSKRYAKPVLNQCKRHKLYSCGYEWCDSYKCQDITHDMTQEMIKETNQELIQDITKDITQHNI